MDQRQCHVWNSIKFWLSRWGLVIGLMPLRLPIGGHTVVLFSERDEVLLLMSAGANLGF